MLQVIGVNQGVLSTVAVSAELGTTVNHLDTRAIERINKVSRHSIVGVSRLPAKPMTRKILYANELLYVAA